MQNQRLSNGCQVSSPESGCGGGGTDRRAALWRQAERATDARGGVGELAPGQEDLSCRACVDGRRRDEEEEVEAGGHGSGCTKPGRGGVAPCVALDAAQPFDFESKKQKEKSDLEAPAEAAGPGNQRE